MNIAHHITVACLSIPLAQVFVQGNACRPMSYGHILCGILVINSKDKHAMLNNAVDKKEKVWPTCDRKLVTLLLQLSVSAAKAERDVAAITPNTEKVVANRASVSLLI